MSKFILSYLVFSNLVFVCVMMANAFVTKFIVESEV